jgi:hypothetical protein
MKPRFPLFFAVIVMCGGACGMWAQAPVTQVGQAQTAPAQAAPSTQTSPTAHLSRQTRMDLEKLFMADLVYIRTSFPMGKKGLTLKNGMTSPNGEELREDLAIWGPAVKPGDQARITMVTFKQNQIRFEINGGPIKKEKWYNHITISGNGGAANVAPSDDRANPRGSYVDLLFDHYVPEMTPDQLKKLLWPVFDFNSKSALEAYLETIPPKAAEAIKNHKVLVGMNREMVIYAKGRPEQKVREKEGEVEHEDWVYGTPPEDVQFVRMIGDEVVRIETMKVDGTKMVQVDREVDVRPKTTVASASPASQRAPTLTRPGEVSPNARQGPDQPIGVAPGPDMGPGDSGPSANPGGMPQTPGPQPPPGSSPYAASFNREQPRLAN